MENRDSLSFQDRVQELNWGAHLCSLYRDKKEQLSVVAPYLAFGLQHNERCIYVTGDTGQEEVCRALDGSGIDIDSCLKKGQLIFLTKEETYLKNNFFSPLAMLGMIQDAHYEALRAGYSGLRGSGELNWTAQDFSGAERVIEYEREINFLFPHYHIIALCQYSEMKVPENVLLGALRTHPKAVIHGILYDNPFYTHPAVAGKAEGDEYLPGKYYELRNRLIA
ncbi:MAG: MEDS domain-containing protein [Candidatus Omnitrophota bacterium]